MVGLGLLVWFGICVLVYCLGLVFDAEFGLLFREISGV